MKISRTAGRTVRARYLVGSSKCLPRLEKPLQKYPSGEFSKRPAMQGGGVILATPPYSFRYPRWCVRWVSIHLFMLSSSLFAFD